MPDSLAMSWDELRIEVGFYIGVCPDRIVANIDTSDLATVEAIVHEGCRWLYFPRLIPGFARAYEWNFLRPVRTFTTVSGTYKYDLPEDFGGFDGVMVIDSSSTAYRQLTNTGIPEIMRLQAISPSLTATPTLYADGPKYSSGIGEQASEVWLHPTPDATLTLRHRYRVTPNKLSSSRPHPYGGPAAGSALKALCLAVAESTMNDGVSGIKKQEALERLEAAISDDQGRQKEFFGYNGNRAMVYDRRGSQQIVEALYNGVLPQDYTG